ncbi:protein ALP1-like [Maniola jurtina]|uniref:uncharacterized protein n=1 Tax=Aphantopus hyperantus TaxID=2795564 RepID=UPI0015694C3C|nr:protein ALP1-like [Maniola hyperantus]XP_045781901.1 protein ALP1-like [Maniola jurtina]
MDVEEAICLWILYRRLRRRRRRQRRYWVHPILSDRLSSSLFVTLYPELRLHEENFFNYFRMSVATFDFLYDFIENDLKSSENAVRYCISPKEKLIVTLRYLATGSSFAELQYGYKIGKSTISGIIKQVCQVLWRNLKTLVMSPPTKEIWTQISIQFENKAYFPNCVGALDGKHVRLIQPPESGSMYYNYKHFFSLVLMALCDANYCFIWIDVGAYGKDSDSGVFKETSLFKKLSENSLNLPEPRSITNNESDAFKLPYVIVADEAFAMTKNLMRPYGGKMLSKEKNIFNYRLSLARRYVECTFGIMCNKWRILHRPIDVKIDFAVDIVKAICVLHNLVRMRDGINQDDMINPAPLPNVNPTNSGRAIHEVDNIRTKFTNYFVTEGKLDWQDKMV